MKMIDISSKRINRLMDRSSFIIGYSVRRPLPGTLYAEPLPTAHARSLVALVHRLLAYAHKDESEIIDSAFCFLRKC